MSERELTDLELSELVHELEGTPQRLEKALATVLKLDEGEVGVAEEYLTQRSLEEMDDKVFRCMGCEWWFATSDASDVEMDHCRECSPEED